MRDEHGRLLTPGVIDPTKRIRLRRLHAHALLPFRSTLESAGLDISACLMSETGRHSKRMIPARNTVAIPTGWALRPPEGFVTLVLSRSGLAAGSPSLFVANSPGLIDPDFTGEIHILLYNGGFEAAYVNHGQRIAQLIFVRREEFPILEVESLPSTERGDSGFGSTGA